MLAATKVTIPPVHWLAIAPELALAGAALVIVLLRALVRRSPRVYDVSLVLAALATVTAGVFVSIQWNDVRDGRAYQAMAGMVAVDGFGIFLAVVVLVGLAAALLLSSAYVPRERFEGPEYLALLLSSATGMLVMISANDLVTVFIALEVLSIPLYVLSAFDRRRDPSLEAGMKYFVLGAFSSAVFLYGIALVYGGTGTTSLPGIATFLARNDLLEQGTLLAGAVLLLVGLGFKVAAVPFHMWTPDVYQGAPTPVTAFMASATKAAGFAALLRVLVTAFDSYRVDWRPAIFALAVLSLVVGSVSAIVQSDIKRLLAYSSIGHAGYVLMGLQAGSARGVQASLFYLFVYTFMIIGSFAVVALVGRAGDDAHGLSGYRGLAQRRPMLAGAFAFFLFAQAGVPFTGGFVAKLEVFSAAVRVHSYALAIIGVLTAVVAAFAYLRVAVLMYLSVPEGEPVEPLAVDPGSFVVLTTAVAATLVLGFLPQSFLHFARDATLLF